jgi:DNA-binding transcriptional regulator YdaS (Cro superfamily)
MHRREEVKNMNNKNNDLKAKIIKKFGSQLAFAKEVNTSELFVSQVINGRRKLSPELQEAWTETLKRKKKILENG